MYYPTKNKISVGLVLNNETAKNIITKKWNHCLKWSPAGGLFGGKIF